jgi:hypothetical protein
MESSSRRTDSRHGTDSCTGDSFLAFLAATGDIHRFSRFINHVQAPPQPSVASLNVPRPIAVATAAVNLPQEKDFEFSDMNAMTCLLCARKFKSQDQLERHNKASDLHKARFPQYSCRLSVRG